MVEGGGLVHWQAKLGMGLVGIGSIGLFTIAKGWWKPGDDFSVMSYILIVLALIGMLMLMLSMGIESDNPELSQTFSMMEEESKETTEEE
jgi:hypothetical protein